MNKWVIIKAVGTAFVGVVSGIVTIAEAKAPGKIAEAIKDGFKILAKSK